MSLLFDARFGSFLLAQILGALSDGALLGATLVIAGLEAGSPGGVIPDAGGWHVLIVFLFALPFVLCAEGAGQLGDRHDRAVVLRRLKLAELAIVALGAAAVIQGSLVSLLVVITLLGTRAGLASPAKYGLMPRQLPLAELTIANALVLAGTVVALLVGGFVGIALAGDAEAGRLMLSVSLVVAAAAGWLASRTIPASPPGPGTVHVDLDFVSGMRNVFRTAMASRTVLLLVLGVSWGWFFAAVLIAQLPGFVRDGLGAAQPVTMLLLGVLIAGVLVGTFLCERISGRRPEIGLVPIGALGMTVFASAFVFSDPPTGAATFSSMLTSGAGLVILLNLFLLALTTALYMIPLYASIQSRADPGEVSRVVAFNNALTALLVIVATLIGFLLVRLGFDNRQVLLGATVMHVVVVVIVFFEVPEFALRIVVWVITHSLYRVRAFGLDNIPERGPAILVCNHVSLVDALIITAMCRRPIRFVMWYKFYNMPVLNLLFRMSGAISIASHREDAELLEQAYDEIAATIERGGLVGYFPEGQLTSTGEMNPFRPGIEHILARTPAPVVPMALSGLWGTFFTRFNGTPLMSRWPRHWLSLITLKVGRMIPAEAANASSLFAAVSALRLPEADADGKSAPVRDRSDKSGPPG